MTSTKQCLSTAGIGGLPRSVRPEKSSGRLYRTQSSMNPIVHTLFDERTTAIEAEHSHVMAPSRSSSILPKLLRAIMGLIDTSGVLRLCISSASLRY
jgi:hypothetical protein